MKNSYKTGKCCIYAAYRNGVLPLGFKANPINSNDNKKQRQISQRATVFNPKCLSDCIYR